MTFTTLMSAQVALVQGARDDQLSRSKPSLWRRWLDAMLTAQQRRADREIARYLATRGGITDDIEREIERRFLFNR